MKSINLNNRDLKGIMERFLQLLSTIDRTKMVCRKSEKNLEYATGTDYLTLMQEKTNISGYPEETIGFDMAEDRGSKFLDKSTSVSLNKAIQALDSELIEWSGSRNNAVKMLYPKGGFMGWHNNANAPGYNIILSWSERGTGFFRYQDPITKELVTMNDIPGWTCKVGYFGSFKEKDKVFWHCAGAPEEERFTLGYIIPHEGLWNNMIYDIESM